MLTARDEEADRLVGLAVGADDYLTKPFSPRELVARIAALLRRVERAAQLAASSPQPAQEWCSGTLTVDVARHRVWVDGAEVHLTPTEFDLLVALARREGRVAERAALLRDVWGWDGAGRTLDSHVKALRRKIGAERVRTVLGVGYALEAV